jgi:glucose-6-phosphate-specific signal transduction histidine kinase
VATGGDQHRLPGGAGIADQHRPPRPHARSVTITIAQDQQAVTVEIVDDAPVAPVRYHRGGYGLVGMRERVQALGGTLHAGPREEAGWSIRAILPVPAVEAR